MAVTRFHIPDLISLCGPSFELHANGCCHQVSDALNGWISTVAFLSDEEKQSLPGLQIPLLASLCYPHCDMTQLQQVSRFLILLFHWTNRFDPGSACAFDSIRIQLSRETNSEWQRRFENNLEAFRYAHVEQVDVLSLDSIENYHALSRSYSGINTLLDLVEYTTGLRIPYNVHMSQEIRDIKEHAHDIILFAKDIIAHNFQQSKGCDRNMVAVIMKERRCTLQSAIDTAEGMFKDVVARFLATEEVIPSWAPEIDEDVQRYVQGLRECIAGFIHWLYENDRYLGDKKSDVREFGWVFLLPKES